MLNLTELRKLEENATPGPWELHGQAIEIGVGSWCQYKRAIGGFESRDDNAIAVASRNHFRQLLDIAEAGVKGDWHKVSILLNDVEIDDE